MAARGNRLAGRVAIITAGGQGIGEALAIAFAREGARLVLTGRTLSKLEAVSRRIVDEGGEPALCLEALAGNRADAERTVAEAIGHFGRIDILVNNAHTFTSRTPLESVPEEHLRTNWESSLLGSFQLMQCAFPHMRDGGGGSIINLGSASGYECEPGSMAYSATKEAVRALTKTAAREWGRYKIRANTLLPVGLTPQLRGFLERTGTYELEASHSALGILGDPLDDVAPVALFLASDDSRYITGQSIYADGGRITH